jgi:drug/metabolite transporter (DMT)-like permease
MENDEALHSQQPLLLDEENGQGRRSCCRDDCSTTSVLSSRREEGNDEYDNVDGDSIEKNVLMRSRFALAFVAFLYATYSISLRIAYTLPEPPPASILSTIRGWMAFAFFLPLMVCKKEKHAASSSSSSSSSSLLENEVSSPIIDEVSRRQPTSIWLAATELAVWNFLGQATYNLGLMTTATARASFLSQTSVIITPFMDVMTGHKVGSFVWIGCFTSFVGLGFLSYPNGDETEDGNDNDNHENGHVRTLSQRFSTIPTGLDWGDFMILFSCACWSVYMLRTSAFSRQFQEVNLQGLKCFLTNILYCFWWFIDSYNSPEDNHWRGWKNGVAWVILLYSALFPGTIADLLQQKAQSFIPASESNVILSMEPIFTVAMAFFLLGEQLSWQESCGGCLLILGSLVSGQE